MSAADGTYLSSLRVSESPTPFWHLVHGRLIGRLLDTNCEVAHFVLYWDGMQGR